MSLSEIISHLNSRTQRVMLGYLCQTAVAGELNTNHRYMQSARRLLMIDMETVKKWQVRVRQWSLWRQKGELLSTQHIHTPNKTNCVHWKSISALSFIYEMHIQKEWTLDSIWFTELERRRNLEQRASRKSNMTSAVPSPHHDLFLCLRSSPHLHTLPSLPHSLPLSCQHFVTSV